MLKALNAALRWFHLDLVAVYLRPEIVAATKDMLVQTATMPGSGEYRRAQALRALLNQFPDARERDIALAIELVICGAV